eukprot:scaffold20721_cov73-Cylindrotheca_fusiformis.AAC.1
MDRRSFIGCACILHKDPYPQETLKEEAPHLKLPRYVLPPSAVAPPRCNRGTLSFCTNERA